MHALKKTLSGLLLFALGLAGLSTARWTEAPHARVGTYDTRAIAVAFVQSSYSPVPDQMRAYEAAKRAGDTQRVHELEEWGEKHQHRLHFQGFCRVPVDDLLAPVQEAVAALAEQRQLDLIAPFCDWHAAGVELVDITDELVQLYSPSDRVLATVRELRQHEPVPWEDIRE